MQVSSQTGREFRHFGGFAHPDDAHTPAGARRLAAKIEAYWRARGGPAPKLRFVETAYSTDMCCRRVDIRSDMVDGRPADAKAARRHAIDAAVAAKRTRTLGARL